MVAWHRDAQLAPETAPPTLIVHGELDEVIPVANVDALLDRWPEARARIIEGYGHALMAQEPQLIAAMIRSLQNG